MIEEVLIAYHEAGHVVLAEQLGGHVLHVTIVPVHDVGPRRHGETSVAWSNAMKQQELNVAQVQVALAGPVAEMIYSDNQYEIEILSEWWADWLVATRTMRALRPQASDRELLELLAKQMKHLVNWMSRDDIWQQVAIVADHLEAHETLEGELLDDLRSQGIL